MPEKGIFSGLKVIELATVLAGPAAGMFFAELGAEVIKIENPLTGGDMTRQWKLAVEKDSTLPSAYYRSVNWGKKVLFTDISRPEGYRQLLDLLETADILLLNFKAGDAEKFALDFPSLRKKFPALIHGSISGYGENDPRPAFDLVMQAETGFMSMNGNGQSGPLKMPVALIDLMAAHQLKEGLLAALYLREKTGKGSAVHVSLYDSAIASLANQASNFLVAGHIPQRTGSLHPNIAPYGETFACADGRFLVLAIGTDQQFAAFCKAIGQKELALDPRFAQNSARVIHREKLAEILRPYFTGQNPDKLILLFEEAKVPFAFVRSVKEALLAPESRNLILDEEIVRTSVFSLKH